MPMKRTDKYDGSTNTEGTHHMAIKAISAKRRKELLSLDDGMAERIKEIMEKQGILDRDLARALDVADRTIYNWKTTGQVSRKLLPLLAEYLNTTTEFLITGEEAHPFQKVTDDNKVVQMQHNVESGDVSRPSQSIVMRYVGIYELDEVRDSIVDDPTKWLEHCQAFATKPTERTCLAVTLNKEKLDQPGIPAFCLQYLIDGPDFPRGTFLGYAIDIAPARGKFCLFALKRKGESKFTFANGYYYTSNDRMLASSSMGHTYSVENKGFVLRLDRDNPSVDDVWCMPNDFEDWRNDCRMLGVATWRSEWLDVVALRHHTGMWERLDRVYEGRRVREQGETAFKPNRNYPASD